MRVGQIIYFSNRGKIDYILIHYIQTTAIHIKAVLVLALSKDRRFHFLQSFFQFAKQHIQQYFRFYD
ncbi:MAG TPA: hypothetical protein DCM62_06490 [Bacteroidales bacterium]|nr:hypothetical protein [Bacteroidales bacterium]